MKIQHSVPLRLHLISTLLNYFKFNEDIFVYIDIPIAIIIFPLQMKFFATPANILVHSDTFTQRSLTHKNYIN